MKVFILTGNDSIIGAFQTKDAALMEALKKFGVLTLEGEDGLMAGKTIIVKAHDRELVHLRISEHEVKS